MTAQTDQPLVRLLEDLDRHNLDEVGGKNASLGEMISHLQAAGIRVPGGFATTAAAYWQFLEHNELKQKITDILAELESDQSNLGRIGSRIRDLFEEAEHPPELAQAIADHYTELSARNDQEALSVAVRSSATAEDLPEASFAGQLETFLNVQGQEELLDACKRCYASLFTDRAIAYRENHGFDHMQVALSVGVQRMVRSDLAGAGVMFSIDTETGFPGSVVINAAWGLGETVVQGEVDPDEYHVFKPLLSHKEFKPIIVKNRGAKTRKMIYGESAKTRSRLVDTDSGEQDAFVLDDEEILQLGRWAAAIEDHYGQPMDMEWAKDGETGELFVVQARPETVHSQKGASELRTYDLKDKGELLVTGLAIGSAAAAGRVCVLDSPDEIDQFEEGAVLVTRMTDPDWVPIMKKAAALVTDHGGRTSHAAIVSRELGLTAVVGCNDATERLSAGDEVTVSCLEGDEGHVYAGIGDIQAHDIDTREIPETRTRVMINLANPTAAYQWWQLPTDGVGLARMEFIIGNLIKAHPLALRYFDEIEDDEVRDRIAELTRGYDDKSAYFVDTLARGMSRIAAVHYPNPVIVRASDFKTNEYAELIGGAPYEPHEENPMLGWRGASRYYSDNYRDGFELECRAIRKVREEIGLDNIIMMIPFCRTLGEADRVLATMADYGLVRGQAGLSVYVMCEIPSNVFLAEKFAERFDGFSIGSNDLTQLVLGIDRDNETLRELFDERDEAVTTAIADLLDKAHRKEIKIGICGQAPSDYPEFAEFLVRHGIDSISVTPDSFLDVKREVARVENSAP